MLNPNEILGKHLPPMQAAMMKHRSRLDEHRIGKLYKEVTLLFRNVTKLAEDQSVARSRLKAEKLIVATCTDMETGLFVQLAGLEGTADNDLLLTFGQKFCQEARDTTRQNTATKIW